MATIANITVFDGAATPVSHTLTAVSVTRDKEKITALWRENLAGVPVYASVRAEGSITELKSGVYKTELRVVVPVMETILNQNASGYTAAPKVAYENTYIQTGFFHKRSDSTGRRLVRQMALNLGGNISTAVTPAQTGPIPELFDLLIAPT